MAYDEALEKRIRRFFGRKRTKHEAKRMMGGLCFMVKGKMCVGVEKKRLMARVGPDSYEDALTRKGCRPMNFTGPGASTGLSMSCSGSPLACTEAVTFRQPSWNTNAMTPQPLPRASNQRPIRTDRKLRCCGPWAGKRPTFTWVQQLPTRLGSICAPSIGTGSRSGLKSKSPRSVQSLSLCSFTISVYSRKMSSRPVRVAC